MVFCDGICNNCLVTYFIMKVEKIKEPRCCHRCAGHEKFCHWLGHFSVQTTNLTIWHGCRDNECNDWNIKSEIWYSYSIRYVVYIFRISYPITKLILSHHWMTYAYKSNLGVATMNVMMQILKVRYDILIAYVMLFIYLGYHIQKPNCLYLIIEWLMHTNLI